MEADGCRFCGGPCPPAKNPKRPRLFCTNAHRAAFRLRERNAALIEARAQLADMSDTLQVWAKLLQQMQIVIDDKVDVLDRLVSQPRRRKTTSA